MELQDRYVKTRQYVSLFNIAENVAYALLKMPNGWVIPSNVTKEFNIQCKKDIETQNGYYIFVDLSENQNGITSIFDSIDFIIEFNNAIEERASIFREKAEILKKLVYSEPINKLKTLEFVFKSEKKSRKTKKNKNKEETIDTTATNIINDNNDVENKNKEDVQVINESDNDDVDEVMAMAKELMEG